jgi:hypothetical protein
MDVLIGKLDVLIEKKLSVFYLDLNAKLDQINQKFDNLHSDISQISIRVSDLEDKLSSCDILNVSGLQSTQQKKILSLEEKFISLELRNRANNVILTSSEFKFPYRESLQCLLDKLGVGQIDINNIFPLGKTKDGAVNKIKVLFRARSDKLLVSTAIRKLSGQHSISYSDDLPPELSQLKNKLLIQRRKLLSSGTKCLIKTVSRSPFLLLVDGSGEVIKNH